MSTPKPTIFFVHGAWSQSAHYQPIIAKLEADGFPALAPTQPTYGRSGSDLKSLTLHDDANFIRSQLQALVDQGHQVIVVLHSYGGHVGTQAVDASLGFTQRAAAGKEGGVLRIVYLTAFMLQLGASLGDAFDGKLPPFVKTEEDGSCTMRDPKKLMYEQLDDETAAKWIALTRPHVVQAQLTHLAYTAWSHHPVAYIVATKDGTLPPEWQRGMIAACEAAGTKIEVHEVPGDHTPHLSREKEVIEILEEIALREARA